MGSSESKSEPTNETDNTGVSNGNIINISSVIQKLDIPLLAIIAFFELNFFLKALEMYGEKIRQRERRDRQIRDLALNNVY